jgi:hypothetical protein
MKKESILLNNFRICETYLKCFHHKQFHQQTKKRKIEEKKRKKDSRRKGMMIEN